MNNLRMMVRMKLNEDIQRVRESLREVNEYDRMTVIAEALMDLNQCGDDAMRCSSCGCFEWDITMDYRNAEER